VLLGCDGTKPYNFRDIAPLSDKILSCASTCSNYLSAYLLAILLLRGGDIHPNPGQPTPEKDPHNQPTKIQPSTDRSENLQKNGDLQMSDKLRILNWNCRGIDSKLHNLPQFLQEHGFHVAILTETQRTISKQKNQTTQQVQDYTFHFSSYIDPTFSSHFLPRQAKEWGVCIAIKNGLAFKPVSINIDAFQSRVLHGTLSIPTSADKLLTLEIIGAYAPAKEQEKEIFWKNLTDYARSTGTQAEQSEDCHYSWELEQLHTASYRYL
jgi:hypothetical protein